MIVIDRQIVVERVRADGSHRGFDFARETSIPSSSIANSCTSIATLFASEVTRAGNVKVPRSSLL